jgi:hypothetical protein
MYVCGSEYTDGDAHSRFPLQVWACGDALGGKGGARAAGGWRTADGIASDSFQ